MIKIKECVERVASRWGVLRSHPSRTGTLKKKQKEPSRTGTPKKRQKSQAGQALLRKNKKSEPDA